MITVPGQALGIRVAHERRAERVRHGARLARVRERRIERGQRLRRHDAQDARPSHPRAGTAAGAVVALS